MTAGSPTLPQRPAPPVWIFSVPQTLHIGRRGPLCRPRAYAQRCGARRAPVTFAASFKNLNASYPCRLNLLSVGLIACLERQPIKVEWQSVFRVQVLRRFLPPRVNAELLCSAI